MRFQSWVLPLALLGAVQAFPTPDHLARLMGKSTHGVEKRCPFAEIRAGVEKAIEKRSLLDPTAAPIDSTFLYPYYHSTVHPTDRASVTGEHAFQPPNFSNGDQRGPCPGLNVLANHGYIPRNGVVTVRSSIYHCRRFSY
jgi:hypothetical protein